MGDPHGPGERGPLVPGDAPPAHPRRYLVRSLNARDSPVLADCVRWQLAHPGGVFVSVAGPLEPARRRGLVAELLAAGCDRRLTLFYEPDRVPLLRELAELAERLWRHRGARPWPPAVASVDVAEILAVGATDTVGVAGGATACAGSVGSLADAALGRAEFARPRALPVPGRAVPPTASRPPDLVADGEAGLLLREGTRLVSLECEQRIDLLYETGGL